MTFLFKLAATLFDIILNITALCLAASSMKTDRLRIKGDSNVRVNKSIAKTCVGIDLLLKLVYWFLIPDTNNILSFLFALSIAVYMIVVVIALVFLLPFHKFNRTKYEKCSVLSSAYWVVWATVSALLTFALSFFISAPIVIL